MSRHQAHKGIPIAIHPTGRPIYEDDPIFDYSAGERIRVAAGILLAFAVTLALVLLMSLAGPQ